LGPKKTFSNGFPIDYRLLKPAILQLYQNLEGNSRATIAARRSPQTPSAFSMKLVLIQLEHGLILRV
jgi:hypothetical protein